MSPSPQAVISGASCKDEFLAGNGCIEQTTEFLRRGQEDQGKERRGGLSVHCGKLGVTWKVDPKSIAGRYPDGGVTVSVMCPPSSCSFWQDPIRKAASRYQKYRAVPQLHVRLSHQRTSPFLWARDLVKAAGVMFP